MSARSRLIPNGLRHLLYVTHVHVDTLREIISRGVLYLGSASFSDRRIEDYLRKIKECKQTC
jgi:hypothetical protein